MRPIVLILALVALVSGAATADTAAVNPARIAAIDQAAKAFVARAAQARANGGTVPRQSDPEIRRLLDTVFDTSGLDRGVLSVDDIEPLGDWLAQIAAIGRVYLDVSADGENLAPFAPEIGRFIDAYAAVVRAVSDAVTTALDTPGIKPSRTGQRKLGESTDQIGKSFGATVALLVSPGLERQWIRDRLSGLVAAGPSVGRMLRPGARRSVHAMIGHAAAAMRDAEAREVLAKLAETIATPPPSPPPRAAAAPPSVPAASLPPAAAATPPPAAPAPPSGPTTAEPVQAEIALEREGGEYWVAVRINGAVTVRCILDTGASTVVLPADLVAEMTQAGTITPTDRLPRQTYESAEGKRHYAGLVRLQEVSVGGHAVKNVVAAIVPAGATPLLGQGVLGKFKSWTLDNHRRVLIITE